MTTSIEMESELNTFLLEKFKYYTDSEINKMIEFATANMKQLESDAANPLYLNLYEFVAHANMEIAQRTQYREGKLKVDLRDKFNEEVEKCYLNN
jgi:hypothetical protein